MKILDFANDEYINLITYRKDGTQVPTPVWLASLDNSLVITTSLNAGKVKRVRANGRATIYKTNQLKITFTVFGPKFRILNISSGQHI